MKPLTLIDKAFLLKRTAPFSSLDLDLLLTIADKLTLLVYDAEEHIFFSSEEANRMYFIVRGGVEIRSTEDVPLYILEPGDFFGEEALFNNKERAYAAFCPNQAYVLTLSRTNLYTIISECPSVAVGFLKVYASALPLRPFKIIETT